MAVEPLPEACVQGVGDVLGDTALGLTGGEIGQILAQCRIPDPGAITKRHRITEALLSEQARTGSGRRSSCSSRRRWRQCVGTRHGRRSRSGAPP